MVNRLYSKFLYIEAISFSKTNKSYSNHFDLYFFYKSNEFALFGLVNHDLKKFLIRIEATKVAIKSFTMIKS